MTEFRHGNRNRRNLYAGPGEEHHIAVTVGPIGHAAAMSAFLADAAKAYIAAGHPMPTPPNVADQLQARIDKVLALHTEFKIYDECGHKHTAEDVDAGRAINIPDVGYTCSDGYEYSICRHCCTGDSGFQSEECAGHVRPCWPCPTVTALTGASPLASPQAAPSVQASGEATGGDR